MRPISPCYRDVAYAAFVHEVEGRRPALFDIFGYAAIRREERALMGWHEQLVRDCLDRATPDNLSLAQEIAALPARIRGYEKIKLASARNVRELAPRKMSATKEKLMQVI